jgi:CDGSH-type Zn-finger protein
VPFWSIELLLKRGRESKNVALETVIQVRKNGSLLIHGTLKVKDNEGSETTKNNATAFCRCGASNNKPYCDGSHVKIDFKR